MIRCPDTGTVESDTDRTAASGKSSQRFAVASTQLRHVVTGQVSYPEILSVKSDELRVRPNRERPRNLAIASAESHYRVAVPIRYPYG